MNINKYSRMVKDGEIKTKFCYNMRVDKFM